MRINWQSVVRKDLELSGHSSYNTTQEMFLSHVGIQNSFVEDNEMLTIPFFVRNKLKM